MVLMKLLSGQEREREHKQDPAGVREHITSSIKDKLSRLPPSHSSRCIYRVPERLRKGNEEAFTPRLVAIGPLHDRDKPHLQTMEDYKLRCLRSFFTRNQNTFAIIDFIVREEATIRQHYEDQIKLDSEAFCEMILLDSIFIVELLLKNYKEERDEIFDKRWMSCDLLHDMILIENQIPLFVPHTLYTQYIGPLPDKSAFTNLVYKYFNKAGMVPSPDSPNPPPMEAFVHGQRQVSKPRHLIEYLRMAHTPQTPQTEPNSDQKLDIEKGVIEPSTSRPRRNFRCSGINGPCSSTPCRCFPLKMKKNTPSSATEPQKAGVKKEKRRRCFFSFFAARGRKNSRRRAKELKEAGVKFAQATNESRLVDINFHQGTLTIPVLKVNELTEPFFRNLIAFEQCERISPRHISDYIIFMDSLIDTSKDADVFIKNGIFENFLNDSEEVAELFNNLYKETVTDGKDYFARKRKALNDYSGDCWHRWKATRYNWKVMLKRDYFSSPWAIISVIAAFVLLVLTVVQTACSLMAL